MKNILIFFTLSLVIYGCVSEINGRYIPPGEKVLVLGDSISEGYGVGIKNSWVSHLQKSTNWQIINAGVSGETTIEGLNRLPALITQYQPQTLIIELGGNDMLRKIPITSIIDNFEQMINIAQAKNIQVILMAIPEVSVFAAITANLDDAKFYKAISKQKKIPLITTAVSEVLSDANLRLDQIHPNEQGHITLSDKVFKKLKSLNII